MSGGHRFVRGRHGERNDVVAPGRPLARRDVALAQGGDVDEQQVEARLLVGIDLVVASAGLALVPEVDLAFADQEALGAGRGVVPAQAVGQPDREVAALLVAAVEAGGNIGLDETAARRAGLLQGVAQVREQRRSSPILVALFLQCSILFRRRKQECQRKQERDD